MTATPARSPFATLLESEAKGFFFLRLMLSEHTTDETLAPILKQSHDLYDQALATGRATSFSPHFVFVTRDDIIVMRMQRAETAQSDVDVVAEIELKARAHPCGHYEVLALH